MSGDFGGSRMWVNMRLAREMGRGEKASRFHDVRERVGVLGVLVFDEEGERSGGT